MKKNRAWNLIERMSLCVIRVICRIFGWKLGERKQVVFLQFVRFGIVGVSNTLISYVLYLVSLSTLRRLPLFSRQDYLIAQVIAFVLSVLWSFYWNNKKVFVKEEGEERSLWKALLKAYVSYSFTGLFLSSILLVLWVQVLHVSKFIAPMINLLISVPINFLINKFWAFK